MVLLWFFFIFVILLDFQRFNVRYLGFDEYVKKWYYQKCKYITNLTIIL
jgi:hypothetical protein